MTFGHRWWWVLAAMIVGTCQRAIPTQESSNVARGKLDVRAIETAVNLFKRVEGRLPTNDEGLEALVGKYLSRSPLDPWGRPYLFVIPGRTKEFDVYTLGADGREGGEGGDADIGTWPSAAELEPVPVGTP